MAGVQRVSRRGFLLGAMATALAACRSGGGAADRPSSTTGMGTPTESGLRW